MIDEVVKERILSQVDKGWEEQIEVTRKLVRIPSVVGAEGPAQDFLEGLYRSQGLEVVKVEADREKLKHHPAFSDTGQSYAGRPNLVAFLPGAEKGSSLILNGHVDVVSPEPISAWRRDPWGAEIAEDRLYGRGAGDMKAGLAANFFALKAILSSGLRPGGSVTLQSVCDEEAGGTGGTLACLAAGYTADGFIATEPHALRVCVAHGGINYVRIKVVGRTAHAGLAHLGVNAIGKILPLYQALVALDERRGREVRFPLIEQGSGRSCHLNVGTLKAGDWPSTVAGEAEMECRVGYIPGEKREDVKAMVERVIREAALADPWLAENPPRVEWFGWNAEPWDQDPDHPFLRNLIRSLTEVTGAPPELIGRSSGNDARFTQYFGMAGACTGPAAGNIHGIDEYVELSSVQKLTRALALTIASWCGVRS